MKKYAVFIILIFVVPNLYSVISGHESYPFTPAPMFTHYVDEKSNFHEFLFFGESDTGEVKLKPRHQHNTSVVSQNRFFFDQIYGSVEHNYPIGTVKEDSEKAFEARLTQFFNTYFDYPEASHIQQIKLVVNQYDNNYKLTDAHIVGIYDSKTKQFTHTWGKN